MCGRAIRLEVWKEATIQGDTASNNRLLQGFQANRCANCLEPRTEHEEATIHCGHACNYNKQLSQALPPTCQDRTRRKQRLRKLARHAWKHQIHTDNIET